MCRARIKMLEKMDMVEPPQTHDELTLELPKAERSAKVVVELEDVTQSYGGDPVYTGLDFKVQRGDRLALLGRNGEGKSTLLKLLAGLTLPTKGRRLVGGTGEDGGFSASILWKTSTRENDLLSELASVGRTNGHIPPALGTGLFHVPRRGGIQKGQRFERRREKPPGIGQDIHAGPQCAAAGRAHQPPGHQGPPGAGRRP